MTILISDRTVFVTRNNTFQICLLALIWYNHFEKLATFYEAKHTTIQQPRKSTPRYLSKRNENKCLYKNFHKNTYSCCSHRSQKQKTTQKPVYKEHIICNEILNSKKKKTPVTCTNVDRSQIYYVEQKKSDIKNIRHIYMKVKNRQNCIITEISIVVISVAYGK